jgi:hypothetical protein
LLPLTVEFNDFENRQRFAAFGTPGHPFFLLSMTNHLVNPFFHPPTADWLAYRLARAIVNDLVPMLFQVADQLFVLSAIAHLNFRA